MLPGDAEKTRIWLRQMIEPARGFDFISFPRYCQTPVLHQTHTKPPKPRPGGSYFAWWFKCPACQTVYLVEAARRFFDATGTAEPLSAPDCSADWVTRERAILPWQYRTASVVNLFGGSAFRASESDPHLLSKTDPDGL